MDTPISERRRQGERYTQCDLDYDNERFASSGGLSQHNREAGFQPAFQDTESGCVYRSRFSDGNPAPIHLLDGLPRALRQDNGDGTARSYKPTLVAGFLRADRFYTREQAAQALITRSHSQQI